MKMNRVKFLLPFVFVGILSSTAVSQKSLRIAAVVNDDIISELDLQGRINMVLYSSNRRPTPEEQQRLVPQILRTLIDDKLKIQEAKKRNIKITQRAIDKAISRLERLNGLEKGGLLPVMASQNIPRSVLIDQIRAELSWSKVANRIFGPRIRVSQDEINERLAEIQKNRNKPEYLVSEIFLPVDTLEQNEKIKKLSNRLYKQLLKGVNFQSLARSFSRGITANAGGRLGWIQQGKLDKKVYETLISLKQGQFSKPIRSSDGYHIVLLHNRRTKTDKPAVAPNTKVNLQQLILPLPKKLTPAELASQMNLAKTMATTLSNCQDMGKAGKELDSQLSGNIGTVPMSKLPTTIQNAIVNLPVNKASSPVKMNNSIIVLMVCKRESVKAPPKPKVDEREKVRRKLMSERLRVMARRYLRDLRRTAVIDIRL